MKKDRRNKKTDRKKHVVKNGKKLSLLKSSIRLITVTIQSVFDSVYQASIDDICW